MKIGQVKPHLALESLSLTYHKFLRPEPDLKFLLNSLKNSYARQAYTSRSKLTLELQATEPEGLTPTTTKTTKSYPTNSRRLVTQYRKKKKKEVSISILQT